MANAFNIDKGGSTTSDTHLINETFHVFSKSPGSPTTSLGGARLKSGHTTTTSDVWADEIPAFFKAATQAKFDLFSTKAVKDDLCLFNGNVYQHNGTEFVSLGTEAEVLVDGATFKKNDKDVIKFHKGRTAINLTADNNNGDGSNNYTAKIYDAATGSTTFVPQFISAMDKMVDGIPSLAYDAAVFAGGSQLAEGLTADNDYICNAYAGVIQFNKARSSGVTVNAWEYIGDKLTTSISGLRQSIKDISDVTLKGVVASVTADENTAQNAGITVDNSISTTPVIKFTAGSVTTGETKLVTGGAVKTYVDTTALAEGGSIATAINAAKEAAIANAKVTLTAGTGITIPNSGKQDTAFTISVNTGVIATKESVDEVADAISVVSQTVASIQSELSTGSVATGISEAKAAAQAAQAAADAKVASVTGGNSLVTVSGDKEVTITVSDTIATKSDAATAASSAITKSLNDTTTTGTIGKAIADVAATANSAVQSVTRATGSSTLLTVTDGTDATISLSTEVATKSDITTEINKLTATDGAITTLSGKVSAIETSLADGGTIHELIDTAQTAADAKVADVTVDGTSIVSGNAGSKTAALTTTKAVAITPSADSASTALATEASVAKALASITSVGVSYEVIPDGQTHTSITAPVNGRIYLEKDTTNAEAGVYIEWMYTEKGWEQIGSTKTDHSTYASKITINGSEKSVANSAVDLGAFASSVTAGNGVTSGSVSATGALSLTLTTASTTTAGISQLTDSYTETEDTKAATGKSIAAAIATLDAT